MITSNTGIGIATLLELGVAVSLFIIEVWAISKGLDEAGQTWQPILDNGETVAAGTGLGTALLVGIDVAITALGTATAVSVGPLFIAVGLGTAILVELATVFILSAESLIAVAGELNFNPAPSLRSLNGTFPQFTEDMSGFVGFMLAFTGEIGFYTDSMGGTAWDSIVSGFQELFASSPIGDLADDVNTIYTDAKSLNGELRLANPGLRTVVTLLTQHAAPAG